jgi:hypothetical protein
MRRLLILLLPVMVTAAPLLGLEPRPVDDAYILLVDDEVDGVDIPQYQTSYYEAALDALGLDYNIWDHAENGEPELDDLNPYDIVIWVTGNSCPYPASNPEYGHSALSLNEEALLRSWLETPQARGLMLSGIWIAYNGVADEVNDEQLPSVFFDYTMGLDYPGANFTDWIEVDSEWSLSGAGGELGLGDLGIEWVSVETYPDMLDSSLGNIEAYWTDPDGEDHHAAVISYEGSSFRTVFFACPLESIDGTTNRRDVIDKVVSWFTEGEVGLVPTSWGQIKALE